MAARTRSTAVTEGVRIEVESRYLPERSAPMMHRFVFAYRVRITNGSERTVQLVTRHWVVTHGDGEQEEVRGPGVVGEQPVLAPGQAFEYTSGAILRTPNGSMHGTYQMRVEGGEDFDAVIAPFGLHMPHSLN